MAKTMPVEKYIWRNGYQRVVVKDRRQNVLHPPAPQSKRWILWNETTQTVVSEHPRLYLACIALEEL